MKQSLVALAFLGGFLTACYAETPAGRSAQEKPVNTLSARTVRLSVNNQEFDLKLENNPTAQAFAELLPLDLSMQDHLNNEKFAALPQALPTADRQAGRIEAGDVMLYQGNTLVIFYESFNSNYRYTRIGKITTTDGLKTALGRDGVNASIGKHIEFHAKFLR